MDKTTAGIILIIITIFLVSLYGFHSLYLLNPIYPLSLVASAHYRGTTSGIAPWQGYVYLSLSEFQIQAAGTQVTYVVQEDRWPLYGPLLVFYSDTMLPPITTQCRSV